MHDRFIYNRKQRHSGAIQCLQDLQLNFDLQLTLEFHSSWKFSLLSTGQHVLSLSLSHTHTHTHRNDGNAKFKPLLGSMSFKDDVSTS